jgi:hypothetical protein
LLVVGDRPGQKPEGYADFQIDNGLTQLDVGVEKAFRG